MNKPVLILLAIAMAPISALAVDGVTLINQSTVTAAGGFPYVISQPGSYKLSGNLAVPAGSSAISIRASNVSIDLNGFNIASEGPSSVGDFPTGIANLSALSNIEVRNGSMFGWAHAIEIDGGGVVTVQNMRFEENFSLGGGTVSNGVAVIVPGYSNLKNVTTDGQLDVVCPTLIADSVANGVITFGAGCAVVNSAVNSIIPD